MDKTPFTDAILLDGKQPIIKPAWGAYWIDQKGSWVGHIDDYGRETIRPDDIYELRLADGRSAWIRFYEFTAKDWLRAKFKAVVMPRYPGRHAGKACCG
jgi:hypothetical protein